MSPGARIIVSGRLPTDVESRRVDVSLLIEAASGTYRAVDIKHHLTTDRAIADSRDTALIASLQTLRFEDASTDETLSARKREDDLLQLAHYQRMRKRQD